MQRLQHQAVAAERDDGVGLLGLGIAVGLGQPRQGLARLGHVARHERDLFEFPRYAWHSARSDPRC